jgi:hypothetical protein
MSRKKAFKQGLAHFLLYYRQTGCAPVSAGPGPFQRHRQPSAQDIDMAASLFNKKQPTAKPPGHIGLDIGTANIVVYRHDGKGHQHRIESNAFFKVPALPNTRSILEDRGILFFNKADSLYVLGNAAEEFAEILGGATHRPMVDGLVNLREDEGIAVIRAILDHHLAKSDADGTALWFSVPAAAQNEPDMVIVNEAIFSRYLKELGYSPHPVNEGLAVVLSELTANHATGIGISMGGGMCNVCVSYLSIPALTYSISKGGDYIDTMVGQSVGESATKIKTIKEQELDLSRPPANNIETGLHIYYQNLFTILAESLEKALNRSDSVPRLKQSVPLVLSGGTVVPAGSLEKFKEAMSGVSLPIRISDIVLAQDPLTATARGAWMMAGMDDDQSC